MLTTGFDGKDATENAFSQYSSKLAAQAKVLLWSFGSPEDLVVFKPNNGDKKGVNCLLINKKGLQAIEMAAAMSKFETLDALGDTIDPGHQQFEGDLGRFAVEMEQLWNCGARKLSCGKRLLDPKKPGFYEMHANWQREAAAQCKGEWRPAAPVLPAEPRDARQSISSAAPLPLPAPSIGVDEAYPPPIVHFIR